MSRESFRNCLFRVVEYLNKYELSDQAKKLILHYFNKSKLQSSEQKAMEAVEFYLQIKIPVMEERSPYLKKLIDEMLREAESWDRD